MDRGIGTGCSVSSINYANLVDKVSLNNPEILLDNLIVVRDEIEDSALIRVLKIVNSSLKNMISGKINEKVGNLLDVEIDPYITKYIITAENIDGFKPKRIHIEKTIEGHRYYYVYFFHQERNLWEGFVLKIKFSGTNGNNIHLEITRGPIA